MMMNCSDIENLDHLWQCVTTADSQQCLHRASVSCTGKGHTHRGHCCQVSVNDDVLKQNVGIDRSQEGTAHCKR